MIDLIELDVFSIRFFPPFDIAHCFTGQRRSDAHHSVIQAARTWKGKENIRRNSERRAFSGGCMQCSCEASCSVTPSRFFIRRRTSLPGAPNYSPRVPFLNIYCGDEGNMGCMGWLVLVQGSCTKCRCPHKSGPSKHGKDIEYVCFLWTKLCGWAPSLIWLVAKMQVLSLFRRQQVILLTRLRLSTTVSNQAVEAQTVVAQVCTIPPASVSRCVAVWQSNWTLRKKNAH